jgi:hypothetical protein
MSEPALHADGSQEIAVSTSAKTVESTRAKHSDAVSSSKSRRRASIPPCRCDLYPFPHRSTTKCKQFEISDRIEKWSMYDKATGIRKMGEI